MFETLKRIWRDARQKSVYGMSDVNSWFGRGQASTSRSLEVYGKSVYVFAAVNKIAQKVSTINPRLYQVLNSKGDTREIMTHPSLDLLYRPNPFQIRSEFFKITVINKKLCGEAFWFKARNKSGKVVELWNVRPDRVTVVTDPTKYVIGYEFDKGNGTKETYAPEDIIHIREPNPTDPHHGLAITSPASARIETEAYATAYQRDFFQNNARPDSLLVTTENLTREQKADAIDSWEQRHKGRGNSSRVTFLEGGLQYQQVSLSQREMDFIESLKFTRDDILVAFGVPKSVITTDDVNLANANTGLAVFLSETVQPEMAVLIDTLNEMLIAPEYGAQFYLDFDDPTPTDRTVQTAEFTAGIDKWLTANEVRTQLSLPPLSGGDSLMRPFSDAPIASGEATKAMQRIATGTTPEHKRVDAERVFIGKPLLHIQLRMQDAIAELKAAATPKRKAKGKRKADEPTYTKLMAGKELRELYAKFINGNIDKRARKFAAATTNEANKQRDRVIANLESGKALKKKIKPTQIMDLESENQIFAEFSLPFIRDFTVEGGQDALDLIGQSREFVVTPAIAAKMSERATMFGTVINGATLDELSATLTEGLAAGEGIAELRDRVFYTYDKFDTYRAERIARTEATAANAAGTLDAYKQSNVVNGKEWIATMDDRTRDTHAMTDGEVVPSEAKFSNGLFAPGDGDADPSETVNCRCVLAPVVMK